MKNIFSREKNPEPTIKIAKTHDTAISLTPIGKEKAEAMVLKSPYMEVLSALLEAGGTATYTELGSQIGWPASQVEAVSSSLMRSGYVKALKVMG